MRGGFHGCGGLLSGLFFLVIISNFNLSFVVVLSLFLRSFSRGLHLPNGFSEGSGLHCSCSSGACSCCRWCGRKGDSRLALGTASWRSRTRHGLGADVFRLCLPVGLANEVSLGGQVDSLISGQDMETVLGADHGILLKTGSKMIWPSDGVGLEGEDLVVGEVKMVKVGKVAEGLCLKEDFNIFRYKSHLNLADVIVGKRYLTKIRSAREHSRSDGVDAVVWKPKEEKRLSVKGLWSNLLKGICQVVYNLLLL